MRDARPPMNDMLQPEGLLDNFHQCGSTRLGIRPLTRSSRLRTRVQTLISYALKCIASEFVKTSKLYFLRIPCCGRPVGSVEDLSACGCSRMGADDSAATVSHPASAWHDA